VRFRLVLFFQGFSVTWRDFGFFSGVLGFVERRGWFGWGFSDRGRGCLDDFFHDRSRFGSRRLSGGSGSLFGFLLQTLGFTLATAYFTWIVWSATVRGQGTDRCRLFNRGRCFGNHRGFDHWSRFDHFWLDRLHGLWRWLRLDNRCRCGWLCGPVERSLLLAGRLWRLFLCWCLDNRFGSDHGRFNNGRRLGGDFSFRLAGLHVPARVPLLAKR
jgi:hypothetical protein